jgi:hypothetical protein
MTVTAVTPRAQYTITSANVLSLSSDPESVKPSVPFKYLATSEVVVTKTRAGTDTTLTETTHYTLSAAGASGTMTFTVAGAALFAADDLITFTRSMALSQATDYAVNDLLDAETLEQNFDKAAMISQQLNEEISRQFSFAATATFDSTAAAASTVTGTKVSRASKYLVFDADGDIALADHTAASPPITSTSPAAGEILRYSGSAYVNSSILALDDTKLYFGTDSDVSVEYDENGNNTLSIDGDVLLEDNDSFYFGSDKDIGFKYDEASTDSLIGTGNDFVFTSASDLKPIFTLKNTNSGVTGPTLKFINDKGAAGAANDICGIISFYGDDAAQTNMEFAKIEGIVAVHTDGQEGGKIKLTVASHDGELQPGLIITDGSAEDEVDVTIGNGADSLVSIPGDLTVTGDFTVSGTTTTVDTTNLTVKDPLIVLGFGTSGTPANDCGLIIERGSSSNSAMIWDESADEFAFLSSTTEDGSGTANMNMGAYGNVRMLGLSIGTDADGTDRTITFGHTALKTVIGIDDSGDVFAINTDNAFEAANDLQIDASGNVTAGNGSIYTGTAGKVYSKGNCYQTNFHASLVFGY